VIVPESDPISVGGMARTAEYKEFHSDGAPIERAKAELEQIGLAQVSEALDGCVVRQRKVYPMYGEDYPRHVATIRKELEAKYPTLHLVGRNGMHKYNNQDHAMMTVMLRGQNIIAGRCIYDLWCVNQDAEYHEAGAVGDTVSTRALRIVPTCISETRTPIPIAASNAEPNRQLKPSSKTPVGG
jgi:hypothetical protein